LQPEEQWTLTTPSPPTPSGSAKFAILLATDLTSESSADVSLDNKCSLGTWIYCEGPNYRGLPEYVKLKYEHARFSSGSRGTSQAANAGESIDMEMVPCSNTEFSASSSAVIHAIVTMKKSLADESEGEATI
jgi:hypothetical protein